MNDHSLHAATTRVALAAYLHDLGKFAETVNHPGFAGVKYFARGIRVGRNRAARLIEQNLVAIMAGLEGGRGLAA